MNDDVLVSLLSTPKPRKDHTSISNSSFQINDHTNPSITTTTTTPLLETEKLIQTTPITPTPQPPPTQIKSKRLEDDETLSLNKLNLNQDPFWSNSFPLLFYFPSVFSVVTWVLIFSLLLWQTTHISSSDDNDEDAYSQFNGLYECVCGSLAASTGNPIDCQTCYYCVSGSSSVNKSSYETYPSTNCLDQDEYGRLPCPRECMGIDGCMNCLLQYGKSNCGCPKNLDLDLSPEKNSKKSRSYFSSSSKFHLNPLYQHGLRSVHSKQHNIVENKEKEPTNRQISDNQCCGIYLLEPSITNNWSFLGPGVMYQFMPGNSGMILMGFGDWSVKQSWVNEWIYEIWKKEFQTTTGFLYSIKGPVSINYSQPTDINVKLLFQSFSDLLSSIEISKVVIVSHGSGTYVSGQFLDILSNTSSLLMNIGSKCSYYLLDGLNNQIPYQIIASFDKVVPVYAYDDSTQTHSSNYQYMKDMSENYTPIHSKKLEVKSSDCNKYARWCVHNTLINKKPYNKFWNCNQNDYTTFSSDHEIQTSYF